MPGVDLIDVQMKELHCELNVLSRPDGSAIFSHGNTVVVVAVYGPVEGKVQNSDIYKAVVEVIYSAKSGQASVRDRLRETNIRQTCENVIQVVLHPRDAITISIQEMEDSGGLMAASLNACCLALVNSGLAMKSLFAAVNCAVKENGDVILDPLLKDLDDNSAKLMFVFDSIEKNVISSSTEGCFTPEKYQECLKKCKTASERIFDFYRDVVKKYSTSL